MYLGGRWQRGGGFNRGRGRGNRGQGTYHPRSRFEEDDEGDLMMDNGDKDSRYTPYGGRRGGRGGGTVRERSPDGRRNDYGSNSSKNCQWWKVVIPQGRNHSREWLINRLKAVCTEPFEAIEFHTFQDRAAFFVNEKSAADALRNATNRITTKDGTKIFLSVRESVPPRSFGSESNKTSSYSSNRGEVETSPEKLEILKTCLGKRYDPTLVKLDLSKLYSDVTLRAGGIEGKIYQQKLMNTILKLIKTICPQLKIMDLSNNYIQRLDMLAGLSDMCLELEELNLSDNIIRSTVELAKIKPHKKLTKLWFNGNPAQEQFKDENGAYVTSIRGYLPGIKELDGIILPPAITFDLQTESIIPDTKSTYSPSEEASTLIAAFLKNFIQVYDSDDINDRQNLLGAYHNDAVFSMCCNTGIYSNDKNRSSLNGYFKNSRNLKRLTERNSKNQLIKYKKLPVVAFLSELPSTKHKLDSFILDVPVVSPTYLCFTLQGMFLEGTDNIPRGFSRTFIAVPESSGQFLIINDQLNIRNPTDKQLSKIECVITGTVAAVNTSYTAEQENLVKRFSTESKMNLKWSLDALVSNSWNYENAAIKFAELKQSGKIPSEAYVI